MKMIKTVVGMQRAITKLKRKGRSIGFVPTMGALHEGHLSLMKRASKESDFVIASIFVNPTQFGPKEDFKKYPRNLKKDAKLCKKAGVDLVFAPETKDIYPDGCSTRINVSGNLTGILEGKSRPGHFKGVATVVAKLFNIVLPDRAYFGEKDYQQLLVIKKMAKDLDLPVKIVPCPTIREKDGLAMSSRNAYLGPRERETALIINRTLKKAVHIARDHGCADPKDLTGRMRKAILSQPGIKLDYVAVCDPDTLKPAKKIGKNCVILIAARIGRTRLIDNIRI